MSEQELEIVSNGEFKNIHPKPNKKKGIKGLEYDNHIVVEKVFAEGYELEGSGKGGKVFKFYSCKVVYKGEECTFLLSAKEHDAYKQLGGEGDKVKLTLFKHEYTFGEVDSTVPRLRFELV